MFIWLGIVSAVSTLSLCVAEMGRVLPPLMLTQSISWALAAWQAPDWQPQQV